MKKSQARAGVGAGLASYIRTGSAAKCQLVLALAKRCAVIEMAAHTENIRSAVAWPERPLRECIRFIATFVLNCSRDPTSRAARTLALRRGGVNDYSWTTNRSRTAPRCLPVRTPKNSCARHESADARNVANAIKRLAARSQQRGRDECSSALRDEQDGFASGSACCLSVAN
jgi:hypothetical protein